MAYRTYYDKNGVILSRNDAYYKIGELGRSSWYSFYPCGNHKSGIGYIIEFWFNIKVDLFINGKPRFYHNLG